MLLPQFFLAGVFNPIHDLPLPLAILSALSPLRYAVEFMRNVFYGLQPGVAAPDITPAPINAAVMAVVLRRRSSLPARCCSCGPSATADPGGDLAKPPG